MSGSMQWFRWHHGSVTDPKFNLVARRAGATLPEVLAVWAFLLESASASAERGHYGEIDCEAVDCLFGMDDGKTASIMGQMQQRGLIDSGAVSSWEKRQPKREREDDNSTQRVQAFREKKRQEKQRNASETPCNAAQRQETPREEEIREEDDSYESSPRAARADDDAPASPGEWIEVFAAEHGIEVDHRSLHDRKKFMPLAAGWVAAGVTVGQMRLACAEARAKATEPIAWLPAYADRVLATLQAPPRQPAAAAETFRERDERLAREKMAAFLPGIAAKGPAATLAARNVIDITPSTFPAIGA